MATLAVGVPVNIYYTGSSGSPSQIAGTVADIGSDYITIQNSNGDDITIGWANVNVVVS